MHENGNIYVSHNNMQNKYLHQHDAACDDGKQAAQPSDACTHAPGLSRSSRAHTRLFVWWNSRHRSCGGAWLFCADIVAVSQAVRLCAVRDEIARVCLCVCVGLEMQQYLKCAHARARRVVPAADQNAGVSPDTRASHAFRARAVLVVMCVIIFVWNEAHGVLYSLHCAPALCLALSAAAATAVICGLTYCDRYGLCARVKGDNVDARMLFVPNTVAENVEAIFMQLGIQDKI